jgi:hypothetical protein
MRRMSSLAALAGVAVLGVNIGSAVQSQGREPSKKEAGAAPSTTKAEQAGRESESKSGSASDRKLIITGTLVSAAGLPLSGQTVCYVVRDEEPGGERKTTIILPKDDKGNFDLVPDDKGKVVLASSRVTDDQGQFKFEFSDHNSKTEVFELGIEDFELGIQKQGRVSTLLKFKIDGKTGKKDLGKIVVE